MELKLQTRPIPVCRTVLDAVAGHPIEVELLLPDYCPDLARVLTCRAEARVTAAEVRGAALTVGGEAVVTLLYLGEAEGIRRVETQTAFQKRFELPCECAAPLVFASAAKETLTCRAVSRRRVEVQGTLAVRAVVCDAAAQSVVCGSETAQVCLHIAETERACLRGREEQTFSLMELVAPPPGMRLPKEILRADCAAFLQEWTPASDGIVLRGELCVSLFALGEGDALETHRYTLPVSRRIETPDAQSVGDVSLFCDAIACTCADEEDARTTLEIALRVSLLREERETVAAADDCFSVAGKAAGETASLETVSIAGRLCERIALSASAPMPEGADAVLDAFGAASPLRYERREEGSFLVGSVQLAALVSGEERGPAAVSASAAVEIALGEEVGDAPIVAARLVLLSVEAVPQAGEVLWSAQALVSGAVLCRGEQTAIIGVTVDETAAAPRDPAVGLRIYYAEAGETVWEIARACGALPQAVAEDNELEEETLAAPRVLLIPTL